MVIATNNPLYNARVIFGQAGGFLEDLRQHQEKRCQEQRPQLFACSGKRKGGIGAAEQSAKRRDLQWLLNALGAESFSPLARWLKTTVPTMRCWIPRNATARCGTWCGSNLADLIPTIYSLRRRPANCGVSGLQRIARSDSSAIQIGVRSAAFACHSRK